MFVYVNVSVIPKEVRREHLTSWSWSYTRSELPNIGARNQTPVLCVCQIVCLSSLWFCVFRCHRILYQSSNKILDPLCSELHTQSQDPSVCLTSA